MDKVELNAKQTFAKPKLQTLAFGEFVLNALMAEYPEANYTREDGNRRFRFDLFARSGIKGIYDDGPLYIEVKYGSIYSAMRFMVMQAERVEEGSRLLLIGPWRTDEMEYISAGDALRNRVIVKGLAFVRSLIQKHPLLWWVACAQSDPKAVIEVTKEGDALTLVGTELGNLVQNPSISAEDAATTNNLFLDMFASECAKRPLALFVGNGASIPFGSDSWVCLSSGIFDYTHPFYIFDTSKTKEAIGDTTYAITSISKNCLPPDYYYDALYYGIYRKYDPTVMHSFGNTLVHYLAEAKANNNSLPLVTYNYDEILENELRDRFGQNSVSSVWSDATDRKKREPKIIHVHGFLPYKKRKRFSLARHGIILTDEEYYKAYLSYRNWTPKTQISLLSSHTCLFVGSSMSDIYQMQLIYKVRESMNKKGQEPWKCFALICTHGLEGKDLIRVINYFASKGVYIIYAESFDALPDLLRETLKAIGAI